MLRISAEDMAEAMLDHARRHRRIGIFRLGRARRFHFQLAANFVIAAQAVASGKARLVQGPAADVCLNPRCVTYALAGGNACPHENAVAPDDADALDALPQESAS